MKTLLAVAAMTLGLAAAAPANAAGCLKGAIVGGIAGHMAGHGVLGAAGGCAVGHHYAERRRNEDNLERDQIRHDRYQREDMDRDGMRRQESQSQNGYGYGYNNGPTDGRYR